jgi:hypothetical protein
MQSKLRWRAKLPESTARETGHLIAMVLNMQLDQQASRARRMVFSNTVMFNNAVMFNNVLISTNKDSQNPGAVPAIQVVLHWRRRNQQRCQVVILSNSEGSFQDPWILAIANLLRQILN